MCLELDYYCHILQEAITSEAKAGAKDRKLTFWMPENQMFVEPFCSQWVNMYLNYYWSDQDLVDWVINIIFQYYVLRIIVIYLPQNDVHWM